MKMAVASELRTGTVIRWRGAPCQVVVTRANGGIVRALLTDLFTRRSWRQRFPEELQLEELAIEKRAVTYLYERADQYWFMDAQTFEQISLPAELVGKRKPFLDEGMTLWVKFIDGRPVSIAFDKVVEARIVSTFPPAIIGPHISAPQSKTGLRSGCRYSSNLATPFFCTWTR
jgi:elongation factor P